MVSIDAIFGWAHYNGNINNISYRDIRLLAELTPTYSTVVFDLIPNRFLRICFTYILIRKIDFFINLFCFGHVCTLL